MHFFHAKPQTIIVPVYKVKGIAFQNRRKQSPGYPGFLVFLFQGSSNNAVFIAPCSTEQATH